MWYLLLMVSALLSILLSLQSALIHVSSLFTGYCISIFRLYGELEKKIYILQFIFVKEFNSKTDAIFWWRLHIRKHFLFRTVAELDNVDTNSEESDARKRSSSQHSLLWR